MSFLQNLQQGKNSLKHADTLVTCADGRRYIERHTNGDKDFVEPLTAVAGFVVDTAPDDVPARIAPHLLLGSQDCCMPGRGLARVLSVGIEPPHQLPGVLHAQVECLDLPETDLATVLARSNPIIANAVSNGEDILVHCNAGVSRAPAVVIGYLMLEQRMRYECAYNLVKTARPCIQPNPGFVKQLKSLEMIL